MLKLLNRFIDWFLPAEDRIELTELRKGRFFVALLLLVVVISLVNVFYFMGAGEGNMEGVIGSIIIVLITAGILLAYKKLGRRTWWVNGFNVISYAMISGLVYRESGGIYSSDLVFFLGSSAWTYLIAGKRSGIFWFVFSFVYIVFLYCSALQDPEMFVAAFRKLGPEYALMNYGFGIWLMFFVIAVNQKNNDTYASEIHEKQQVIAEKNREITDSINYAKRLQEAILPPLEHVREVFNDFFILYKPKDIVAGDFYWMERRDHHVFFAVADCTGHGVPGAMVSVVCSNALNHAVREFKLNDPGLILDKVSDLVQQTFEKSKSDVNDGMDISLLVMDTRQREINWAGANNSLWLAQDGKLSETKANKQPIGRHENKKPFKTHTFTVQTGDVAYLFTDGFADQFGGPKGKKFKYRQLMKTIDEISGLPAKAQEDYLAMKFASWQGNLEQVDDVCIAGIRFN
jgi:serine phosphatase RsbU (regulator of sigma subunit)